MPDRLAITMISAVFLFGMVVIFFTTIRHWLKAKKVEYQKQREEENTKIRTLAGKKFSVWVRTTQEKKTDMETALLGCMVDHGLTVVDKRPEETPEGVIMIKGVYEGDPLSLSGPAHYLDMRAAEVNGATKVVQLSAARHFSGNIMGEVAHAVLVYLSEVLK